MVVFVIGERPPTCKIGAIRTQIITKPGRARPLAGYTMLKVLLSHEILECARVGRHSAVGGRFVNGSVLAAAASALDG